MRERILRRARSAERERWEAPPTPDHLLAWNLPKKDSGAVAACYPLSVALSAPLPLDGLKLIL